MNLPNIPQLTMETIKNMEDMSFFTHAQVFDDLLIVAQRETACFVLKTTEGLTVIDAIWPCEEAYRAVIEAIKAIGWNPEELNKLILTHGHVDHTGCGKWFVQNHHVKTYLSQVDDTFWREHPTKPDRPETWKDYQIDCFIKDKDTIACGDRNIYVLETPGHTPGCLSYIFPVAENGTTHMAALFGGATPPWGNIEGTIQFLGSAKYFMEQTKKLGADVFLCNHTVFDNGLERIAYAKKRTSYMPNIYVLEQADFARCCNLFLTLGFNRLCNDIHIHTERLQICPISEQEILQLIEKYQQDEPALSSAYQEMLTNCRQEPKDFLWNTAWKICGKEQNITIGYAGFKGNNHDGSVEIGYGINEGYMGKGYATEAVHGLCEWALQQEVTEIFAETTAANEASKKVLQKTGFQPTGTVGEEGPIYVLSQKA